MHIESVGRGADLVLVHGWGMHGGIFAPLSDILRDTFTLHVVDLPGHGFSRDDMHVLDPHAVASALIDRVPRALWVGWSLGGLVTLDAALSFPDRIRGIVEIAASPRFLAAPDWPHGVPLATFEQFESGLLDDYRQVVERFLALEVLGSQNAQAELRELRKHVFERGEPDLDALKQGMRVLENADFRARLSQLAIANLWIAGRRDRLVPSAAMAWASQQNPLGSFVEFSSGHAPFISHAAQVAQAISEFAGGLAP
ncbi:MAG: pimeloyl-ACP methyl ester esterase BioH [Rudaea sp.]